MEKYVSRRFLIILIAPSGGGKSTIAKHILNEMEDVDYSVSYTTRKPRGAEKNGIDYFFVSEEKFKKIKDENGFLESALVHNSYYGTSRTYIEEKMASGKHIVLDIDVQGAKQIMNSGIDCVTIFILPPNILELEKRLRKRSTDSTEAISLRLKNAKKEIAEINNFEYLVINDKLDLAVNAVKDIIKTEEMKISRKKNILNDFMEEKK
ncbi:MAG: guanylate kinase [Candidatus Cloacimonadota bacterium]|nr:guanylate kinase [Candidatus Cloacimonadota bacterium]